MNPVVLPELRFRRLWFSVGLLMAGIITVVCLMPGSKVPQLGVSDKFEHLAAFGALAFWFGSILVRRDLVWLALALVLFGGLIEVAQGAMRLGREADLGDLLADTLGVFFGLMVALTPLGRWALWFEQKLIGTPA